MKPDIQILQQQIEDLQSINKQIRTEKEFHSLTAVELHQLHTNNQKLSQLSYEIYAALKDSPEMAAKCISYFNLAYDFSHQKIVRELDSARKRPANQEDESLIISEDAEQNFLLGFQHLLGIGFTPNVFHAKKYFAAAAQQNHPRAQSQLACLYLEGDGIAKDIHKAIFWFTKSAKQGYARAKCCLGWIYNGEKGVEADFKAAIKWLTAAAEQSDVGAQTILSTNYAKGKGVVHDKQQAVKWSQYAADQGNALAQTSVANFYSSGWGVTQDYQQAFHWYRLAALQKMSAAQYIIGNMRENGVGCEKNLKKAYFWYLAAAGQDNPLAQHALGSLYQRGKIPSGNSNQACYWYKCAAQQGHIASQLALGAIYENGTSEAEWQDAYKWYRRAALQGNAQAQFAVAMLYKTGKGIRQSEFKTFYKWCTLAAKNGLAQAQVALADWYLSNSKATHFAIRSLYQKAAKQKDKAGQFALANFENDRFEEMQEESQTEKRVRTIARLFRLSAEQGHQCATLRLKNHPAIKVGHHFYQYHANMLQRDKGAVMQLIQAHPDLLPELLREIHHSRINRPAKLTAISIAEALLRLAFESQPIKKELQAYYIRRVLCVKAPYNKQTFEMAVQTLTKIDGYSVQPKDFNQLVGVIVTLWYSAKALKKQDELTAVAAKLLPILLAQSQLAGTLNTINELRNAFLICLKARFGQDYESSLTDEELNKQLITFLLLCQNKELTPEKLNQLMQVQFNRPELEFIKKQATNDNAFFNAKPIEIQRSDPPQLLFNESC